MYQLARLFALQWKLALVQRHSDKSSTRLSILDYGCGTGHFVNHCSRKGFDVQGVEPSEDARRQAVSKANTIHATLDQVKNDFDVITLWHVLEHVEDLNDKIIQLKSHLKKNGTIFIAVPNHLSADAKKYGNHWAGYDVPRHLWHFSDISMTQLLRKHELKKFAVLPMRLDAFYVSMLSEKYVSGKQTIKTLLNGAISGLSSNLAAGKTNYSSQIFVVRK